MLIFYRKFLKACILALLFTCATSVFSQDIIEDTAFGEDVDSFKKNNTIEFINNYSKPNNGTPLWNQLDTIYTKKDGDNYWQLDYGQYQRYNQADNSILFNKSADIYTTENNIKYIASYSIGAGDFTNSGYIPKYKLGGMLQIAGNQLAVSPILDYKYNKYQDNYSNYLGIYFEKYINNIRILAGPLTTQSSFYKGTYGGKLQLSYYLENNNSLNYYFSSSDEPEIIGANTQVWRVISNSIVYKYNLGNGFVGNIGAEYVVNQNIYNRTGVIIGAGYAF